jgi:hypothetical protein
VELSHLNVHLLSIQTTPTTFHSPGEIGRSPPNYHSAGETGRSVRNLNPDLSEDVHLPPCSKKAKLASSLEVT